MSENNSRRTGACENRFYSPAFFVFGKEINMLVYYRRNKQTACYDSEQLLTVSRTKPPELIRRPFASCGDCPYPSHGFQCYAAEGDCLKTHLQKLRNQRKAEKT
jgi:hypothetical protein